MKNLVFILFFLATGLVFGQDIPKNNTGRALSFKEMQRQFHDFKSQNNLQEKHYWKNYKRWEYEMGFHTDLSGEPAGFEDYIKAAIEVSETKQNEKSSAVFNWVPSGPSVLPNNLTGYMENGIGRINCMAFHPTNPNTFFAGVAQGGVWKTTNNGVNWTPLTDNLPITRISDICIDPLTPNTMYIAVGDYAYIGVSLFLNGRKRHTHYGLGVYKTTDGGLNWAPTGLTFQLTNGDASLIKKIVIHPTNTNQLLACGANGMYKSINGGTNWTHVLDSMFWDMQQDPVNPNIIYAATGWVGNSNIGTAGIYKSIDFGSTWTMLNTGMPLTGSLQRVKLAIAPSDPNYIYAICSDYQGGFTSGLFGFYKSTNAGLTWTYNLPAENVLEYDQGQNPGGQGTYDLALLVHPTDKNTIYTGGINVWGSIDGAASFNPITHWTNMSGPSIHGDVHYLNYQASTGQYFACTDGGLYRTPALVISNWVTSPWPTVWTKLNNNMQATSFYRLSSSKNNAGRLIAGAQDNATFYYEAGNWSTIFGGDGMDNFLDPLDDNMAIGASQYGNYYFTNDDGVSNIGLNSNPNFEQSEWVTPIAADYNHPGVLYVGNENVVKTTNNGLSWNPLATIFSNTITNTNTEISALAVANSNSLVIYAARRVRYEFGIDGIIFRSVNGGSSFTNITSNLPDSLYYTGIEANLTDANTAYVCMAGFSAGNKVFKTTNGGTSWTNISYNLPNIPVNCIKQLPGTNDLVVATDFGVYVLVNNTTTWISQSAGLPHVIISDIEFNMVLNKVYVSTFGRGIWESNYSIPTFSTSIQQRENDSFGFTIYPTVNKGSFELEIREKQGPFHYEIINVMGQVVQKNSFNTTGKQHFNLDLPPGVYYFRINSGSKQNVQRFIVE